MLGLPMSHAVSGSHGNIAGWEGQGDEEYHSFWFSVNAVFQEKVSMYANIPLLYHPRAHLARPLCCSALIREAQCSAPNAVTAY